MKVFLATEFRCNVYKGEYYVAERAFRIFERYAKAFGDIVLCARFENVEDKPFDCYKADFISEAINCISLAKVMVGAEKQKMINAMKTCDFVIGRFPSIIAFKAHDYAKQLKKIFVAELMCDGFDSYWHHSLSGKIIAPYMTNKMKKCTWDADFAIYVTEKYLQNKYPCKNPSINASNVVIKNVDQSILIKRINKIKNTDLHNISLMTSANVDQHSKGQEYVVKSMKILKEKGINITYYLAGGGDRSYLERFAQRAGVIDNLIFMGRLSLEDVFKTIDDIDIYIQPSLQEGLPRSAIEAMSRACPVMGARTAGIPELIDDECVFDRCSEKAIAESLMNILNNGLEKYAQNNFEHSKNYNNDILDARRSSYFEKIKRAVESKT